MERTRLTAAELAARFADLHPPFSADEARVQAARCLFCWDAPCTRACPTRIDVPRFIRQILHGNPVGAAATILDANALGGSCARVCPTEVLCEGACVTNELHGAPVPIGQLQRHAVDHPAVHGRTLHEPGPSSGRRVAVIGSGPAGLSAAYELRRQGHAVTVFEARSVAGGLNTLGIAAYKITTDYSLSEVERIRAMGVELRLGAPVAPDGVPALLADYDAVFLGVGLGPTVSLGIPGEEALWEGLDFVFQTHTGALTDCVVGRQVVVIGGGNTAIDCATAAARLGAEQVTLAYRRTAAEMPAYPHEVALARRDGVAFEWLLAPVAAVAPGGKLEAIRCQRLEMVGEGRAATLRPKPGEEVVLPCDMAIKALGQGALASVAAVPGLRLERGRVVVDPATGATSVPGLFAGGDCVNGGAEVVNAVQEGKVAAAGIGRFLAEGSSR